MPDTSKGLSGTALTALSVGALLVYSGFRGVSPLQALRDVSSGKPSAVSSSNAGLQAAAAANTSLLGPTPSAQPTASSLGAAVVNAAMTRKGDKYSQGAMQRISVGYSDCSSFVAKDFADAGVTSVKAWWTTMSFRGSSQFKVIPVSEAQAGDVIITPFMTLSNAHMALVTAPGQAIGQQNSHSNVQLGTFGQIMAGKSSYVAMRYVGTIPTQYQ